MTKSLSFLLRFETEGQKKKLIKIAEKNSRSLNSQINHFLNIKIMDSGVKEVGNQSTKK